MLTRACAAIGTVLIGLVIPCELCLRWLVVECEPAPLPVPVLVPLPVRPSAVAAGLTPPRLAPAVAPVRPVPVPRWAAAPDEVSVGVPLLKPEEDFLFEGGVVVLVVGELTLGAFPGGGSGVSVVAGMLLDTTVEPLVCAVMLVEELPIEPEPLEVEPPEPEVDPPAAPGVALPPGQTTPGLVSGSWSVVPLLLEVSVLWLPSPDEVWVSQIPVVPEPLPSVPEPLPSVPEPLPSVPEPLVSVPEPLVSVPEPLVSVPEPLVSVPEPLVSVPDPLSPGVVSSWPLLVVLVLSVGSVVGSVGSVVVSVGPVVVSVGFVVVVVGVLPVSPELVSVEQVSEPLVSVDCVVEVSPGLVAWVEPSVGQVVTCVSEPARAPSAPLVAPAVDVSVESKLSLDATRMRLAARALAALWATALWAAFVWTAAAWRVVVGRAAALTVWVALTGCDWTGVTCELKLLRWEWTAVRCELKPDATATLWVCAGAACASAQCEPPRPSAPATPKTAAPAALMSATEQSHLLRSIILSRHRVITVPDSILLPGSEPST
jgi:signal-induced proliferation-associated 1 like protein 3